MQWVIIGLDNGLATNRPQAITWINVDLVQQRIVVSLALPQWVNTLWGKSPVLQTTYWITFFSIKIIFRFKCHWNEFPTNNKAALVDDQMIYMYHIFLKGITGTYCLDLCLIKLRFWGSIWQEVDIGLGKDVASSRRSPEPFVVPFHKDFSSSGKQLEHCKLAHEL